MKYNKCGLIYIHNLQSTKNNSKFKKKEDKIRHNNENKMTLCVKKGRKSNKNNKDRCNNEF